MRRNFGLMGLLALGSAMLAVPAMALNQAAPDAVSPRLPKKQVKAIKRMKTAEPQGRWPRSKNPPAKRKLKRNMNHVSRRVRRKHRRAA